MPGHKPKTKKKSFPDLSGDGKTTMKDILIGRGVIKKPGGKKEMPGMKKRTMKRGGGMAKKKRVKKAMGGAMKKRVMKRGGGMMKKPMMKRGGMAKKK